MWRFGKQGVVALTVAMVVGLSYLPQSLAKPPSGGGDPPAAALNPAIAFVTTQTDTRQDVVVASADLASEIVLTKTIQTKSKGLYTHLFGCPAWSADGRKVAFWALDQTDRRAARIKLYVASADGSQAALIRDFRSRPSLHEPQNGHTGALNWSPSGLELVYEGMAHSVVAIDAATGDIRVLLDGFYTGDPTSQPALSPDLDAAAAGYQGMVAMRGPDGSVDANGTTQFDIFVAPIVSDSNGRLLPIDRTLIANVTNSPGTDEFHPSWSPDGSAIACFHDDGTDQWLAVIDVPTRLLVPIWPDYATQVGGDDRATWTSDGLHLVYRTELSGIDRFDLTIIAADGAGGPANYTKTSNRREQAPAWNPQWDPLGPGAF